jgi:aryl-alcohol dehydrogenase-like predicted oxidoreductase
MRFRDFKPFGKISSLTLGGGGIGNVWGETTRKEAVETVNLALQSGIDHLDVAPMYGKGEAERVVGEVAKDKNLNDINITTKCRLGNPKNKDVYDILNNSLCRSLKTMNVEKVNLFLLHSQLIEDDYQLYKFNEGREKKCHNFKLLF